MATTEDYSVEEFTAGQQIVFAHTANNVSGVLAVACGASDTTITLSPGGGALFPNAPFYCSIEFEVVWCLSKSGDSLVVQRGFDGTTATTHAVGVSVEMRNNAGLWTDAYNGINSVSADVGNLATNITNKSALPPDVVYTDNVVSLTHKTIDLTDPTKQNVIIGTVQPNPAALPLPNLLVNGGFEEWYFLATQTLAAGTPTSGSRTSTFSAGWQFSGINDSSITVAQDTAHTDPASQSGIDLLINVSTVQAADWVGLQQGFDQNYLNQQEIIVEPSALKKLLNLPISLSVRANLISGNVLIKLAMAWYDGASHSITSTQTALTAGYNTYKFENQIPVPNQATTALAFQILFQGVGQIAVDNVMANIGPTAVGYQQARAIEPKLTYNYLTNGGFQIWQRGTSGFTTGMFADRWQANPGSGSTFNIGQTSASNIEGNTIGGFIAGIGYTHSTASGILQYLTDQLPGLIGKKITLSMRVYVATANAVALNIAVIGGTGSVTGPTHPGNGYQIMSLSTVVGGGATILAVGLNLQASCTVYAMWATLVVGDNPAIYLPMYPADDLARCQRYYQIIGEIPASFQAGQYQSAGAGFNIWVPFKARMAVQPTVTRNGTWALANTTGQPTAPAISYDGYTQSSGVAAATGTIAYGNNNAGCNFTAEANP